MLWIALFVPDLPLQAIEARLFPTIDVDSIEPAGFAHVICEGPDTRPVLCAVNASARALGLRVGQTVGMARALVSDLVITSRRPALESEALERIATIACQYTPNVTLAESCVLLEVGGSLSLFGGPGKLLSRLRRDLHESGYKALTGIAPTPLAATLFARARVTRPSIRGALNLTDLPSRLADLPLTLFDWSSSTLAILSQLGIAHVRDMARLPRDGASRRFGTHVIADLDRALGRTPDPRAYFKPPEHFSARIEFMREVEHFEGLRFPIRRMLGDLENFLRARAAATPVWHITFEHGREHASAVSISTHQSTRHRERWEELLVERMMRAPLAGDVSAVTIACDELVPHEMENSSWLPDRKALSGQASALAERLAARLGEEAVFCIAARQDHRPEFSWRAEHSCQIKTSGRQSAWPYRPVWLLPKPQPLAVQEDRPFDDGAMTFLTRSERLESGWWSDHPVRRDYFVALNSHGEKIWIYRELSWHETCADNSHHRWWLHGRFA